MLVVPGGLRNVSVGTTNPNREHMGLGSGAVNIPDALRSLARNKLLVVEDGRDEARIHLGERARMKVTTASLATIAAWPPFVSVHGSRRALFARRAVVSARSPFVRGAGSPLRKSVLAASAGSAYEAFSGKGRSPTRGLPLLA